MTEKRIVQLRDPDQIARWWGTLGTLWRVVAIDVHRGELVLEQAPEVTLPPPRSGSAS